MVTYCHKCKRHFFAEMERCPHCASQIQAVTCLKTASILVFILAVFIAFVVAHREQAPLANRRSVPPPPPTLDDRHDRPFAFVDDAAR